MLKKTIFALLCILATQITNAQMSYYSQDPCMANLLGVGCTEEYETKEDDAHIPACPGMKVRITLSKLVCQGKVVSIHIWSTGCYSNDYCGDINNVYPFWNQIKQGMEAAINSYSSKLIAELNLNNVLVSTGGVCKTQVSFTMPSYISAITTETSSNVKSVTYNTLPGGSYSFTIPCKSTACCFGFAEVSDNKIVNVVPGPGALDETCPNSISDLDVKKYFKEAFNVANGDENKMYNLVMESCQPACNLNGLIGDSEGVYVNSSKSITAGTKVDYNIYIQSTTDASILLKYQIKPSQYQIIDFNGKEVEKKLVLSNTIDIKTLSKGIYFLKVNYDNGFSSVVKFLKQ